MAPRTKSQLCTRWLTLALLATVMFGSYYCYDNPAALKTNIQSRMGSDNYEFKFNMLYTVYSIPNVILPFLGGFFVDRLGGAFCMLIFSLFIGCGQLCLAIGVSRKSWMLMFIGRVIFGLGGENIAAGQSAMIAEWFKGKELAFAMGLALSLARLGSVINNVVSPALADANSVTFALWFGFFVCCASSGAALILTPVDKAANVLIKAGPAEEGEPPLKNTSIGSEPAAAQDGGDAKDPWIKRSERGSKFDGSARSGRSHVSGVSASLAQKGTTGLLAVQQKDDASDNVKFTDALRFGPLFWLVTISCFVVYGCVLPFNNIAQAYLLERNYFQKLDGSCVLENRSACDGPGNPTVAIFANGSRDYARDHSLCHKADHATAIPDELNIPGQHVGQLSEGDIDCDDDFWKKTCMKVYCDGQSDAIETASHIMSIPFIISACISPFLGGAVDKFGHRATMCILAPIALAIVHLELAFGEGTPVPALIGQGLAYSVFAAVIWPAVAYTVDSAHLGMAYGLITAVQNIGLAAFPAIVAAIYSANDDTYLPYVEVLFVSFAVLGMCAGVGIQIIDRRTGGELNRPGIAADTERLDEVRTPKEAPVGVPPEEPPALGAPAAPAGVAAEVAM